MGSNRPIRIQSMANVSTMDTDGAVAQSIRLANAGAEYIRFATQGEREVRNLGIIRGILRNQGCTVPIVADVHFNSAVADLAAAQVDKVRINPGNYAADPELIRSRLHTLLRICTENGTAIRIGVNHGSLSERIKEEYGDTPEGMVASCMEFLQICREVDFNDIVISIKASNTGVMVKTVRLLVNETDRIGMNFPLHLGVTEAGDGEDGRIKSAVGIGALLADGIGDTIRVSLSENPENELPVARTLVDYITGRKGHELIQASPFLDYNHLLMQRHITVPVGQIGGGQLPVVLTGHEDICFVPVTLDTIADAIRLISRNPQAIAQVYSNHINPVGEVRACIHHLIAAGCNCPIIIRMDYNEKSIEALTIKASADFGTILLDGFGDGLIMTNNNACDSTTESVLYGILQATRLRISRTDYISCPGCGRTLYDLQSTIARIKAATSHLKHLKIAIMGCIVNGPGEMADADYGYVGAGRGLISLYKGKSCVMKNIPEAEAVERLVSLVKANGDWHDADQTD
jgi:(E)-4-hydroxy-3-methylbut-2-enyl-diphosphate synthase